MNANNRLKRKAKNKRKNERKLLDAAKSDFDKIYKFLTEDEQMEHAKLSMVGSYNYQDKTITMTSNNYKRMMDYESEMVSKYFIHLR